MYDVIIPLNCTKGLFINYVKLLEGNVMLGHSARGIAIEVLQRGRGGSEFPQNGVT